MYESPISLEETCLDVMCNNISTYIEPQVITKNGLTTNTKGCDCFDERSDKRYKFRDSDIFLINRVSERLMEKMVEKGILCDATLNIFSELNTKLKTVKIKNCKVTKRGLEILRQHKITDLEIVNLKNMNIEDILGCLGDWSLQNLVNANFANCTFADESYSVTNLTSLKSLKSLNLSYTDLNQSTFKIICESLGNLSQLNISGTQVGDLKPLCMLSKKLVALSLCDLIDPIEHLIPTLKQLKALKFLDVSLSKVQLDAQELIITRPIILQLLNSESLIPNLISLNISGWAKVIDKESLLTFIKNHPKLTFLGIVLNDVTFESAFCDPTASNYVNNIKIAGLGNEEQIKVTLQCYKEHTKYVEKALYHLYRLTYSFSEARPDLFKLVLPVMEAHPSRLRVQMLATACLCALTNGDDSKKIHLKSLSKGVNLILEAIESFPDQLDLQRISLLALYNSWILQEAQFDRHRCARLMLDIFCSYKDAYVNEMAVAICDILSSKYGFLFGTYFNISHIVLSLFLLK
ncbi:hypothetical protein GWI33_001242 [Rhynchophorus ferrugineus]|uniref:Protein zer-1 homolog-like C-terminal domain-containing protein n=1 Tax=Rhynchophorus ferrugineus TaxID=354439 RepID=A0A834ILF5_RHYFE|nr:hypothetical protein GWI33_001242 [Rhynchophorus ferrugineus]